MTDHLSHRHRPANSHGDISEDERCVERMRLNYPDLMTPCDLIVIETVKLNLVGKAQWIGGQL